MTRRGDRRRRGQRPAATCAPACARSPAGLDVLGQRRAAVPQGRQPARRRESALADATPADVSARRRARTRGRARPAARARPHRAAPELYDAADELGHAGAGRTSRCSGGTPATIRRQAVRQAARRSTCSATTRRSCTWCAHNDPAAVAHRHRGRHRHAAGCGTSPASSCRRGTRASSTGG